MMAVSRNPNEYAFVYALERPGDRRRFTPKTVAAIGVAAAVHIALLERGSFRRNHIRR